MSNRRTSVERRYSPGAGQPAPYRNPGPTANQVVHGSEPQGSREPFAQPHSRQSVTYNSDPASVLYRHERAPSALEQIEHMVQKSLGRI